jgi:N-methylhydantoinase B
MSNTNALDPFVLEITRNRLDAVVADMATTLIRTSGNAGVTEGHDLSCAIYDEHGNGLAYSYYILIHVRSTKEGVLAIKRDFAGDINPGDVFIANDPYWGGGVHPGDVCVFKPIFADEQLIGFSGASCHLYDVGGMTPGSFSPQARNTFQESLNIPPAKIVRRGEIDPSVWNLILNNVRTSQQNAMDFKALIASCNLAEKRLMEIVGAMGVAQYRAACQTLQELSEAAVRARIARIQDGVYEATNWLEHNGHDNDLYRVHWRRDELRL